MADSATETRWKCVSCVVLILFLIYLFFFLNETPVEIKKKKKTSSNYTVPLVNFVNIILDLVNTMLYMKKNL